MIVFCLAFYQVDFLSCKQSCTLNDLGKGKKQGLRDCWVAYGIKEEIGEEELATGALRRTE